MRAAFWQGIGAAAVLLALPTIRAEEISNVEVAASASTLGELRSVCAKLAANVEAQDQAWPTREEDLANESAPPQRVRELDGQYRRLRRSQVRLEQQLEARAAKDYEVLTEALSGSDDECFVSAVVPMLVESHPAAPELSGTFLKVAEGFERCPPALVEGLRGLDVPEAAAFLLKLGKRTGDLATLAAAVNSGDLAVTARVVRLADGDSKLARVCRVAIARFEPRPQDWRELKPALMGWIDNVRSLELKSILITCLGLHASSADFDFLTGLYRKSAEDTVRVAALNALGRSGQGGFLLAAMEQRKNDSRLRRTCIHALGASRYRAAVPALIEVLREPKFRANAARALRRISGQDLGLKSASWIRWWRTQPDSGSTYVDVDEG